jgi:hypothetical protein
VFLMFLMLVRARLRATGPHKRVFFGVKQLHSSASCFPHPPDPRPRRTQPSFRRDALPSHSTPSLTVPSTPQARPRSHLTSPLQR